MNILKGILLFLGLIVIPVVLAKFVETMFGIAPKNLVFFVVLIFFSIVVARVYIPLPAFIRRTKFYRNYRYQKHFEENKKTFGNWVLQSGGDYVVQPTQEDFELCLADLSEGETIWIQCGLGQVTVSKEFEMFVLRFRVFAKNSVFADVVRELEKQEDPDYWWMDAKADPYERGMPFPKNWAIKVLLLIVENSDNVVPKEYPL